MKQSRVFEELEDFFDLATAHNFFNSFADLVITLSLVIAGNEHWCHLTFAINWLLNCPWTTKVCLHRFSSHFVSIVSSIEWFSRTKKFWCKPNLKLVFVTLCSVAIVEKQKVYEKKIYWKTLEAMKNEKVSQLKYIKTFNLTSSRFRLANSNYSLTLSAE